MFNLSDSVFEFVPPSGSRQLVKAHLCHNHYTIANRKSFIPTPSSQNKKNIVSEKVIKVFINFILLFLTLLSLSYILICIRVLKKGKEVKTKEREREREQERDEERDGERDEERDEE